jgi:putative redox protein
MAENKIISAKVTETGESAYTVDIEVSGYQLKGDEPVSSGGGSLGPAPYDTLLAALGECTAMTVRWYAVQQKWPLEKVEVSLTHHKEGWQDIFEKAITLHGNALTVEQRTELIEVAAKCPVQRTLEGTPIIRTKENG